MREKKHIRIVWEEIPVLQGILWVIIHLMHRWKIGDKIIFEDQIHYTFVKNTTFNGIKLPSLAIWTKEGELKMVHEFGYDEYKNRLS